MNEPKEKYHENDSLKEKIHELNWRLAFIEGYLGLRLTNNSPKPVL